MINETFLAKLGTPHPEQNPVLEGTYPPLEGRVRPLADDSGEPLLPRIARALRDNPVADSAHSGGFHQRSVLDAGAAYPAVDHAKLAEYEARGRKLQAQASADLLLKALSQAGTAVRALRGRVRDFLASVPTPAHKVVDGGPQRSALDAGDAFPAISHEKLAEYEARGRKLQAQVTADLLIAGGRLVARAVRGAAQGVRTALSRLFTPAPATLELERLADYGRKGGLDLPADYEARRAAFYGRGL